MSEFDQTPRPSFVHYPREREREREYRCWVGCRPHKVVWHGSHLLGERAMDTYCDAWHSAATDKIGLASSLLKHRLLDQERYTCNHSFIVLCVEATSETSTRRRRRAQQDDDAEQDYQDYLGNLMTDDDDNNNNN